MDLSGFITTSVIGSPWKILFFRG